MEKADILKTVEATLAGLKLEIGDRDEIAGEGVFDSGEVTGLLAVDAARGSQKIVLIGTSSKLGGGLKIEKKVLFPKDDAELTEFLEIVFTGKGTDAAAGA